MSDTFYSTMCAYVSQNPEKYYMRLNGENRIFIVNLYGPIARKHYGYTGNDFKGIYAVMDCRSQKTICGGIAVLLREEIERRHMPKGNTVIIPFPGATAVSQKSKANTAWQC